jgi:hypothetical protein
MPYLTWVEVNAGPVTSIDWSKLESMRRTDPYLCWLDVSHFVGAGQTQQIHALLELVDGCKASDAAAALAKMGLTALPIYAAGPQTRYLTAVASAPANLKALQDHVDRDERVIERYEVSAGVLNPDFSVLENDPADACEGESKLVGFIDFGCAFAQQRFMHSPVSRGTRLIALWNQQVEPYAPPSPGRKALNWRPPALYGYGLDVKKVDLDGYMTQFSATGKLGGRLDEEACYRWARYEAVRQYATHGTHVMDVAVGRPNPLRHRLTRPPPSIPPMPDDTPLAFVQLPQRMDGRPIAGLLRAQVLDALRYLESLLAKNAEAVFNLSYGGYCGPHDGSSILEGAMDELIARHKGTSDRRRVQIVIPTGNALDQALHGQLRLPTNGSETLHWNTLADDPSDSFCEIWLPEGADIEFTVTPPGPAAAAQAVMKGQAWRLDDEDKNAVAAAVFAPAVCQGELGTMLLLAVAPSVMKATVPCAPAGCWIIGLRNRGSGPVIVDAWCERDQPLFGTEGGPRQAYFSNHVEPTATCNAIAHGYETLAVGGYVMHIEAPASRPPAGLVTGPPAAYSGTGPGRGLPGRQRHPQQSTIAPRKAPDLMAPSDDGAGRSGIAASAVLYDETVRLSGTSIAAAAVTRYIVKNHFMEPGHWSAVRAPAPACPPGGEESTHPDRCEDIPRLP